jgi:hypothetical protein
MNDARPFDLLADAPASIQVQEAEELRIRWTRFTAAADVLCPQCRYSLRGSEDDLCPECGARLDVAGLMYCSPPLGVAALFRSLGLFWGVLAINLALFAAAHWGLDPLHPWTGSSPPPEWYGATSLRFFWFLAAATGFAAWKLRLLGVQTWVDWIDSFLRRSHLLAFAATLAHGAWFAWRVMNA